MYHLSLQVTVGAWQLFSTRKADSAFREFMLKVFKRDNYTCQFCDFYSQTGQDIINIDNNYYNNKLSNLVTSCYFCTQCFFMESIGLDDYGGGTLIYLPEFSQAELNSLCHILFMAIDNDGDYKSSAQSMYRSLKLRSQPIDKKFGTGMSNPSILGKLLIDLSIEQCTKKSILSHIRLLPAHGKFRKQIKEWMRENSNLGELFG